MSWFDTREHRTVYEGYSKVHIDVIAVGDEDTVEREYVENFDAAAVVPLFDDGTVLLLKQYRHPVGRYMLEIPAGKLDVAGESPEDAAARELVEEAGQRPGRLEHLTTFFNSAGWITESTHVYAGHELTEERPGDGFEAKAEEADMEVVRIPFDEAVAMVRAGTITDAKTVIGLLLVSAGRGAPSPDASDD